MKFAFALPIAIGLLALIGPRSLGLQFIALIGVAGLATISDARSLFGISLGAALLVARQMRPSTVERAGSWLSSAVLSVVTIVAIYNVAAALLVGGFLGAEAQQRSLAQLGNSGSLILEAGLSSPPLLP